MFGHIDEEGIKLVARQRFVILIEELLYGTSTPLSVARFCKLEEQIWISFLNWNIESNSRSFIRNRFYKNSSVDVLNPFFHKQ